MNRLFKFKECQSGITSIEYGLIGVVVAVFIVSVLYGNNNFISALQEKFSLLASTVISAILTS
ncbi:Flp family type IVb pilin [Pasteurella oralis]|uniref:Flp family type IVb pilin n=1 Tax=Pasteurella oralis TaxID=1071947 RepID=A0ABW4NWP2_9PAST